MIEILENLDVLYQPQLDLTTVTAGGIALGTPATSVPRQNITKAQSSVVARYRGGTNTAGEYYNADERQLTLDEVIDHTAQSDGFMYCSNKLTYKVQASTVVGFAIYGSHLDHFAHLAAYENLPAAFGRPDRVRKDEAYGDVMGYDNYYWGAHKHVRWDAWDDRVSLINLGSFEGNTGP